MVMPCSTSRTGTRTCSWTNLGFYSQHAALLTLSGGLCAVRAKEALQASWVTGSYQTVGRYLELEGLWEESHPLLLWRLLWICDIVATIKSSRAKNRGQNRGWCARYICLQVAMATKYHSDPGKNSFFSAVQSAKLNTFGCHGSGAVRKHLYATRRLRCWKQTWNENLQTWSTTPLQPKAFGFHPLKKNAIVKEQIDITDDLVESKCAGGCCFAIGFVCLVVCLSAKFLASLPLLVVPLFCVVLLLH